MRWITENDGAGDGTMCEIPYPKTPPQVHHVTTVDMEREQRADKVTGDHEVLRFGDGENGLLEYVLHGRPVRKQIGRAVFGETVPACR